MRHPLDRIEPTQALKLYKDEYDHLVEISPPIVKKVLKEFNSKFRNIENLSKPEICSKLVPTSVFKMTDIERDTMISKINHKKKNTNLMETFFNLNGVKATDEELDVLQETIDNAQGINVDESNSLHSENSGRSSRNVSVI